MLKQRMCLSDYKDILLSLFPFLATKRANKLISCSMTIWDVFCLMQKEKQFCQCISFDLMTFLPHLSLFVGKKVYSSGLKKESNAIKKRLKWIWQMTVYPILGKWSFTPNFMKKNKNFLWQGASPGQPKTKHFFITTWINYSTRFRICRKLGTKDKLVLSKKRKKSPLESLRLKRNFELG